MIKKMRAFMIVIMAMSLLLSGCSSNAEPTEAATTAAPVTEAPTTQAPTTQAPSTEAPTTQAPTTEAPTTQAPTTETASEKTVSNDFDPASNETFEIEGIEFQVPANWVQKENAFYACEDPERVAVLTVMSMSGINSAMMENPAFVSSYAGGMQSAFQEDAEVISSDLVEVNGRKMIRSELRGVTNGHEAKVRAASMMNAADTDFVALLFVQFDDGPVDYFDDYEKIIENLKFTETTPETKEGGQGSSAVIPVAHDFDPKTNKTYEIGGIEYQVPANWEGEPPTFYAAKDPKNFTMFYYTFNEGVRFKTLHEPANLEDFENAMKKSLGLGEDEELIRSEFVEIGGREVHWMTGRGTVESLGKELEITFVTMASADKKDTIVFSYWTTPTIEIDYSEDFMKIIENLKNVD